MNKTLGSILAASVALEHLTIATEAKGLTIPITPVKVSEPTSNLQKRVAEF